MKGFCLVCQNIDCKSRGSEEIIKELEKQFGLVKLGLEK